MVFLYTNETLYFLLNNKTISKVLSQLIIDDALNDYSKRPVTYLTKYLGYKNKSTVSRALKELRRRGIIDKDNKLIKARIV